MSDEKKKTEPSIVVSAAFVAFFAILFLVGIVAGVLWEIVLPVIGMLYLMGFTR